MLSFLFEGQEGGPGRADSAKAEQVYFLSCQNGINPKETILQPVSLDVPGLGTQDDTRQASSGETWSPGEGTTAAPLSQHPGITNLQAD